jgi:hypothetical protein
MLFAAVLPEMSAAFASTPRLDCAGTDGGIPADVTDPQSVQTVERRFAGVKNAFEKAAV